MTPGLLATTLRALVTPRRLVPILVVCVPLVIAQARFTPNALAVGIAILMCFAFVLVGPLAWRMLFPGGGDVDMPVLRLAAYALAGIGTMGFVGYIVPRALGVGITFLTAMESLFVTTALFLAGGWGLGRDIDMEKTLGHERARAQALEREAERAQLLAMRSHLDPHFLFNTLNAIAEWCREDGAVAERATLQLSDMLRAVLAGVKAASWPLERELALIETLFSLHLIRDPELFTLVRDLPSPLPDIEVPPMLLLPIAENAVKHGPAAGHRGEIRVTVGVAPGASEQVRVCIESPGRYRGPREGGEGLPMVEKRLRLAYDGRARWAVRAEGDRTVAEILLPRDARVPEVST